MNVERVADADSHIIKKEETAGSAILGVVPGRARIAKSDPGNLGQHQIGSEHCRPGRAQGGLKTVRILAGVGIDLNLPFHRRERGQGVDVQAGVGLLQLLLGGQRRIARLHEVEMFLD